MNYKRLYVPNGIVFITIVTSKRREILINNVELLKYSIANAHKYYTFSIIAISILKNHIHFLLQPLNIKDYSKIITLIKRTFSKNIDISQISDYKLTPSNKKRKERDIWQKRFWEHTIRDENDLYKHLDYIHYNSFKHYQIAPKDWEYSSFKNYVNKGLYEINWLNFGDKYEIEKLNYE